MSDLLTDSTAPALSAVQEAEAEAAFEAWRADLGPTLPMPLLGAYAAWMAAWRLSRHGALEDVDRQRQDAAQRIACGATHPDPEVEADFAAVRRARGYPIEGGCGTPIPWLVAYRCIGCGRFMHERCLRAHFAESGHDAEAQGREAGG